VQSNPDHSKRRLSATDRILKIASIVSFFFLTFVAGAFVTEANVFPASLVGRAYYGARAAYENLTTYRNVYTSSLWYANDSNARGVTIHEAEGAFDGFTLYTSGHAATAYLIDMDGTVLHEWGRPYSSVWERGATPRPPKPDTHVWFHNALVEPDGELLAVYEAVGDTPYGYGLVKLDRDSNVVWTYFGGVHHDFDVGADGRIYALAQKIVDRPLQGFEDVGYPRLDDFLVVLSPEGHELKRISLIEALSRSPFRFLLQQVTWYGHDDPTHTNAVDLIEGESALRFAFGDEGQVLLSMRELGTVLVLDVESERVVWATRGSWIAQHDAQVLDNGHLLMFDNWGNYERPEGISRVIEVDPQTSGVVWSYAGTAERPLASTVRSSVQRLPNGNTLISESDGGRLLEVNPRGHLVWEYVNPRRGGESGDLIPIVNSGQRIDPAYFDPEFRSSLLGEPYTSTASTDTASSASSDMGDTR
jgi:hypothetical protein